MTIVLSRSRRLQRFTGGEWRAGHGDEATLLHAALGHVHAVLESDPSELPQAVDWARRTGGPALRQMSFHNRAKRLRAVAHYLKDHQDILKEECLATGATLRDNLFDCNAGIRAMSAMASRAMRELPDQQVLCRGPADLSQDGEAACQRILTPRTGVAVHITCYDFPVRGLLERLTPALLAGMPCILRPASDTAFVAEVLVRLVLKSGLLPKGALQLVYCTPDAVPDQLDTGDVITCSGSRALTVELHRHPKIASGQVRLQIKETGLAAAVLGGDVKAGSAAFDSFLNDMADEITIKSGQRGSAVRRILVPRAVEGHVAEALAHRLEQVPVGLPDDPDIQMGAMVSLRHRDQVRDQLRQLAPECERMTGLPEEIRLQSGDPGKGAFLNPVLLRCEKPMTAQAIHQVCVRGPVATVLAYDGLCEAIALAGKAQSTRGSTIFTDDVAAAQEAAECLAGAGGSIRICGSSPTECTSNSALLIEAEFAESGVIQAMQPYLNETELKGPPQLLTTVTGQWVEGAETNSGPHPFRKPLSDLRVGDQITTPTREITKEDVENFAHLTGDTFYAHMDDEAVKTHPFFGRRVAHGQLVISFANGMFVDPEPGPMLANVGTDNLRFHLPVYFGDRLYVRLTCKCVAPPSSAGFGEVCWDCTVFTEDAQKVASFDLLTLVQAHWPPASAAS